MKSWHAVALLLIVVAGLSTAYALVLQFRRPTIDLPEGVASQPIKIFVAAGEEKAMSQCIKTELSRPGVMRPDMSLTLEDQADHGRLTIEADTSGILAFTVLWQAPFGKFKAEVYPSASLPDDEQRLMLELVRYGVLRCTILAPPTKEDDIEFQKRLDSIKRTIDDIRKDLENR